ncbi:unnamed protein product [Camellia sinensis]
MLSRQKIEKSNLEKVINGRLFSPFSSPSPSPSPQTDSSNSATKSEPAPDEASGGFDPESLVRGAKALQQINTGDKQQKMAAEQRNLIQQEEQTKAQMLQ